MIYQLTLENQVYIFYLLVERCHLGAISPWVEYVRIAVETAVLPEAATSRRGMT